MDAGRTPPVEIITKDNLQAAYMQLNPTTKPAATPAAQ